MRTVSGDGGDTEGKPDLDQLRTRIDAIDRRLIDLLNERARVVVKVGELKRGTGQAIYAPHREAAVLRRVLGLNEGPLPPMTIEAIYRELMSGSFALERPLRIGYLGPPGSFSHVAATTQFGSSVSFENLREITGVFTEVRREHVDYGLVPIENSTGGGIAETLDAFRDAAGEVFVYAEITLSIRHNLLANCEPRDVQRIYSKPEVFAQCRNWLATQYPQADLIPAPSSSQAVIMAKNDTSEQGAAAIGSALAGRLHDMAVLFEEIEDNPNNITRFFVIARQEAEPSGDDKTSLMFTTKHEPGALVSVLQAFAYAGINLTHIDKRPSRRENWSYAFFIDAVGHRQDARMMHAIDVARPHCQELWILGSYPRAARIL
jgi:chorismate mutase / prephenate dehydratase